MKRYLFTIFLMVTTIANVTSQILQDTISYDYCTNNSGMYGIMSQCNYLKTSVNYTQYLLAQKGIVKGMEIYGIALCKTDTTAIQNGAFASITFKYKFGNSDSSYFKYPINAVNDSIYSDTYYINNYVMGGLTNIMQYSTSANNLIVPDSAGWITFMFDQPIKYTGGSFELFSDWNAINNSLTSNIIRFCGKYAISGFPSNGSPVFITGIPSSNCIYSSFGGLYYGNIRYSLIIYHSPAPQLCNSMPFSGGISGSQYICVGKDFHLYLVNPSAGPGIGYQWQKSPIPSGSWVDIAGATNAALTYNFPSAIPTNFRCKVTCTNSGFSAYTTPFPLYPYAIHVDSVSHSVTNNVLSVHCFSDDTSSTSFRVRWNFGDSSSIMYYGAQVQKTYTVDGTYNVKVISHSDCCSDSLTFPITIGCSGSPTFVNTISAIKDSTCAGSPATLIINDTLPNNYTVQWYRFTWSGGQILSGSSGASIQVFPNTPFDTYYNKAICNISGNFKYSNYDTVYITPPPTAGTIQALNTTTNYYNFTNSGMNNAQSFTWYFGDGDSSSSLTPSHHYNLAGTYNVWFVVTNAGNGCTDTAFTNVTITTGVEDVQGKFFSVSPNPFNESFTVNCPSGKGTITVTDAVGKVVASYQLPVARGSQPTTDHSPLKIDMKGFSSGVYLVKYQNESQTETVKIIKE